MGIHSPPSSVPLTLTTLRVKRHRQQDERTWRHLDTMQFETLIHARTPRVSCPEHGVRVIKLPWAKKYSRFTLLFEAFAVEVPKASKTVKHAQSLLRLSWEQAMDVMKAAPPDCHAGGVEAGGFVIFTRRPGLMPRSRFEGARGRPGTPPRFH